MGSLPLQATGIGVAAKPLLKPLGCCYIWISQTVHLFPCTRPSICPPVQMCRSSCAFEFPRRIDLPAPGVLPGVLLGVLPGVLPGPVLVHPVPLSPSLFLQLHHPAFLKSPESLDRARANSTYLQLTVGMRYSLGRCHGTMWRCV